MKQLAAIVDSPLTERIIIALIVINAITLALRPRRRSWPRAGDPC